MTPLLLGAHAALACIAGAAMVVSFTEVYYLADLRCSFRQAFVQGCGECLCAATNECDTVRPRARPALPGACCGCHSADEPCPGRDMCGTSAQESQQEQVDNVEPHACITHSFAHASRHHVDLHESQSTVS
jgi:hypothetical protein